MKITLICVGKCREKYFTDAADEYLKRLSRYAKTEIIEVRDEKTPEEASEHEEDLIRDAEGQRILAKIPENSYVISLALDGKAYDSVGLSERINNFPSQLSGGEQQRVSIARALAKKPKLLLCDEPTGALDYNTGKSILKLLQTKCREDGMTVVLITHNSAITPMANRVIRMRSGKVVSNVVNPSPKPIEEIEW